MLKIITALPPEVEQNLLPQILAAGHQVLARAADAGELLQRIEEQQADLLVLYPNLLKLSRAVLELLEGYEVRILMLVADDAEAQRATELGYAEHYPAESSWEALAGVSGMLPQHPKTQPRTQQPLTEPVIEPNVSFGAPEFSGYWSVGTLEEQQANRQQFNQLQASRRDAALIGAPPEASQLIAVWGAHGAPGRSTVAVNLAKELSAQGQRVLLIDADSYGGSLAAQLGLIEESSTLAKLCRMAALEQLDETTFARLKNQNRVGERLWLLTGILNPRRWPELAATRIRAVLELAVSDVDIVLVDIGFNLDSDEELSSDVLAPRRNAAALTVLELADRVVAVSGSTPVALGRFLRGYHRLSELVEAPAIVPILNRAPEGGPRRTDVLEVLERFGAMTPAVIIPDTPPLFGEAEQHGRSVAEVRPKHEASEAFGRLARLLQLSGVPR